MSNINPWPRQGLNPPAFGRSNLNLNNRPANINNTGADRPAPRFDRERPFTFDQQAYNDPTSLMGSIFQVFSSAFAPPNSETPSLDQTRPVYAADNAGGLNQPEQPAPPKKETNYSLDTNTGNTGGSSGGTPINGGGPNTVKLNNNSDQPMRVAFMKNPTPESPHSEPQFVEVGAGQTADAALPDGWAGRFYKVNESGAQESTLGEVNFENGKTWYDVSAIDGYNGAMTIDPTNEGTAGNNGTAGSSEDLRDGAPEGLIKTGPNGESVLASTDPIGDNSSNGEAVEHIRERNNGTGSMYTTPTDDRREDSPMRDTSDKSLTVNLY